MRAQCAELFTIARETLGKLAPLHPDVISTAAPETRLISSLAEGADVLAAEAALECGLHVSACLPFSSEAYARDFGEREWKRTAALLEACDAVMTLSEGEIRGSEVGYEMAGQIVLEQSDILIAVWDGEAARGRGGTAQIIAEAVAQHQPVLHIDATGQHAPELLWSGLHAAVPDRPAIDGVERADAREALPALIEALCLPPGEDERKHLLEFTSNPSRRKRKPLSWPLLLWFTGAKPRPGLFPSDTGTSAAADVEAMSAPFRSEVSARDACESPLIERFLRADERAGRNALRFRSSFVFNFGMSGLAVLLALSGLLFPTAKIALILAELLVICLIIVNTRRANRANFHQRWLDRRHLAERLRQLMVTSRLGRLGLRELEDGTRHPGWVTWYVRATAREIGLPNVVVDRAYLKKVHAMIGTLIAQQGEYHRGNAEVMHRADHRLHRQGSWLFAGTIVACVAYLAARLAVGKHVDLLDIGITEWVTFLTALLPALAAALYGIRMQGDFAGAGERSAIIARQLRSLQAAVDSDPLLYARLVQRTQRLGEIMLAEVNQWRLHNETRPISLPG